MLACVNIPIICLKNKNSSGNDKASDLIIEIAKTSAFFASKKARTCINSNAAIFIAFYGWKLSEDELFYNRKYHELNKCLKISVNS